MRRYTAYSRDAIGRRETMRAGELQRENASESVQELGVVPTASLETSISWVEMRLRQGGLSDGKILLHAPNVHTGGGLVLLRQLMKVAGERLVWAQLDERARHRIEIPTKISRCFVRRSLAARARAEWRLWRISSADRVVLCFHGLPPWFPVRGKVVVFHHDRNLFRGVPLRLFPPWVAFRIAFERAVSRIFRNRVDEYVVQSCHMKRKLAAWRGEGAEISMVPFGNAPPAPRPTLRAEKRYDFVYVSSGHGHKNHARLLEAWSELARQNVFPSLALTVELSNRRIVTQIETLQKRGVRITNLGILEHADVLSLYHRVGALIFPSLGESLGLPLLEAVDAGLPIVAAERDYVRDFVTPAETFDPESPVSIARAVRRFLLCPEPPATVLRANDFVNHILRQ